MLTTYGMDGWVCVQRTHVHQVTITETRLVLGAPKGGKGIAPGETTFTDQDGCVP